jgi:hypothetical protein
VVLAANCDFIQTAGEVQLPVCYYVIRKKALFKQAQNTAWLQIRKMKNGVVGEETIACSILVYAQFNLGKK